MAGQTISYDANLLSSKAISLPLSELEANRFKGYKQLKNDFEGRGKNQLRQSSKTWGSWSTEREALTHSGTKWCHLGILEYGRQMKLSDHQEPLVVPAGDKWSTEAKTMKVNTFQTEVYSPRTALTDMEWHDFTLPEVPQALAQGQRHSRLHSQELGWARGFSGFCNLLQPNFNCSRENIRK